MLFKKLWADEVGALASLETVMLGTVGVLAMSVGLSRVSEAINAELTEMAMAVRSFDQSFSTTGYNSSMTIQTGSSADCNLALSTVNGGAFKAASGFVQQPPNLNVQQVSNQGQNSASINIDLAGGDFGNFRQGQFSAPSGGAQAFPGAAQSFPGAAQGFAGPSGRNSFDGGAAAQSFNTPNGLPPSSFNRANKLFESQNCDVQ